MAPANHRRLRVAAVWGDTVLGSAVLAPGQPFDWQRCLGFSPPEHVPVSPVRSAGDAWEIDAAGAVEGYLRVRGREENVAQWATRGAPLQLLPGDVALLQYGALSLFAQPIAALPRLKLRSRSEPWMLFAVVLSATAHLGFGYAVAVLSTPLPVPEPLELLSDRMLYDSLGFRDVLEEDKDKSSSSDRAHGADSVTRGRDGPLTHAAVAGAAGEPKRLERPRSSKTLGPVMGTGSLSDIIGSGAGAALMDTLASMKSGSSLTSGLDAKDLQWGGGVGTTFKGVAPGARGNGVPYRLNGFATGVSVPGTSASSGRTIRRDGPAMPNGPGAEKRVAVVSSGGSSKGLSSEEIRRVVQSRLGQVRACYEAALENAPGLRGSVTVSWHIDGSGAVPRAVIASSTLANGRVEGCVTRVVRGWRFRNPQAVQAEATWGFAFTPSG